MNYYFFTYIFLVDGVATLIIEMGTHHHTLMYFSLTIVSGPFFHKCLINLNLIQMKSIEVITPDYHKSRAMPTISAFEH